MNQNSVHAQVEKNLEPKLDASTFYLGIGIRNSENLKQFSSCYL